MQTQFQPKLESERLQQAQVRRAGEIQDLIHSLHTDSGSVYADAITGAGGLERAGVGTFSENVSWIKGELRRGKIPSKKVDGIWIFKLSDLSRRVVEDFYDH